MGRRLRGGFQIICDVLLFIAICALLTFSFKLAGPVHRGFSCDDASIKKPYVGDTVSLTSLLIYGLVLPICLIFVIEMLYTRSQTSGAFVKRGLKSSLSLVGLLLYGLLATMVCTEIGKVTVSRLRPHFMDTCRPAFSQDDCSQGYIEDYNCTNTNVSRRLVEDAYKSFPSGHASLATYVAVFFMYVCHYRITTTLSIMFKFVLQGVALVLALISGLSRVRDHRHHLSDVLVGFVLGALVAYWLVTSVGHRVFKPKGRKTLRGSEKEDVAYMAEMLDKP